MKSRQWWVAAAPDDLPAAEMAAPFVTRCAFRAAVCACQRRGGVTVKRRRGQPTIFAPASVSISA